MNLMPPPSITYVLLVIATGIFMVSSIQYFLRLLRDPSIPDMVLAIDLLAYDLSVLMVLLSILSSSPYLAIGALPLILWTYLLNIYVSKYLVKRGSGE